MSASEPIGSLYNRKILTFAADIPHLGRLTGAQGHGDAVSRLCGSEVHVDINAESGRITEFAQEVKACALGQTSASIVGRHVIGSSRDEVAKARDEMEIMLKKDGPPPGGKFSELEVLSPVKEYSARHASVLLIFDALLAAFDDLEDPPS